MLRKIRDILKFLTRTRKARKKQTSDDEKCIESRNEKKYPGHKELRCVFSIALSQSEGFSFSLNLFIALFSLEGKLLRQILSNLSVWMSPTGSSKNRSTSPYRQREVNSGSIRSGGSGGAQVNLGYGTNAWADSRRASSSVSQVIKYHSLFYSIFMSGTLNMGLKSRSDISHFYCPHPQVEAGVHFPFFYFIR